MEDNINILSNKCQKIKTFIQPSTTDQKFEQFIANLNELFIKTEGLKEEEDEDSEEESKNAKEEIKNENMKTITVFPDLKMPKTKKEKAIVKRGGIKIVQTKNQINLEQFILYDISLKSYCHEDKIYIKNNLIYEKIRRGNSYLWTKDMKQPITIRKGLQKFFYYSENHKISEKQFNPVKLALQNKNFVYIYNLEKANGENAQISCIKLKKEIFWVIASKNVAILVQNENDIKKYSQERFSFAVLIAETWFKIIEKMPESQLLALEEICQDFTLVGEYCGNPMYQHIVKYESTNLFFYAMVSNQSNQTCIPPPVAIDFFQIVGLPSVKMNLFAQSIQSYAELHEKLRELENSVAKTNMNEGGEGSVIYLVEVKQKNEQREFVQTLSLCKMKTKEYTIWRKIREMAKKVVSTLLKNKNKLEAQKQVAEIEKNTLGQILKICEEKDREYYKQLFGNVVKEIENEFKNDIQITANKFSKQFVQFLEKIKQLTENFQKN